jgi:hypothetical protein
VNGMKSSFVYYEYKVRGSKGTDACGALAECVLRRLAIVIGLMASTCARLRAHINGDYVRT